MLVWILRDMAASPFACYDVVCLGDGRSSTLVSAAARFSCAAASQISWRKIRTSAGASMPMRTDEPESSRTVTMMSSPRLIRSPALRVMTSMCLLRRGRHLDAKAGRSDVVQLHLRKQWLPDSVTADLVDHLPAEELLGVDDDRAGQVDREVGQLGARPDDAEDLDALRPRELQAPRVVVADLHLVVGEE